MRSRQLGCGQRVRDAGSTCALPSKRSDASGARPTIGSPAPRARRSIASAATHVFTAHVMHHTATADCLVLDRVCNLAPVHIPLRIAVWFVALVVAAATPAVL